MDLSALIFVALAVAWAVYLIPKALKHHDDVVRSRSVDRFSHTMRVLARREPVNRRDARLVVTPGRVTSQPVVTTKGPAPTVDQRAATRAATRTATKRRRRVLGLVLLADAVVVTLAATGVIDWWYVALPAGLLVAWLVACRLMVRQERRVRTPRVHVDPAPAPAEAAEPPTVPDELDDDLVNTSSTPAITDPSLWDPMPVTLPTYVNQPPAARRTVRTIDLDGTGVWTSGRTEQDAQIARDAEDAERAARAERKQGGGQRAVGS